MANKTEVELLGKRYRLVSQDSEPEEMQKLAKQLDERMRQTANRLKMFDSLQVSMLTALQLSEDYDKLKKDYDELIQLLEDK